MRRSFQYPIAFFVQNTYKNNGDNYMINKKQKLLNFDFLIFVNEYICVVKK